MSGFVVSIAFLSPVLPCTKFENFSIFVPAGWTCVISIFFLVFISEFVSLTMLYISSSVSMLIPAFVPPQPSIPTSSSTMLFWCRFVASYCAARKSVANQSWFPGTRNSGFPVLAK